MRISRRLVLTASIVACLGWSARADVKLPAVIGDNMVLQAGKPLPIWGWADPGEAVTVKLGTQSVSTKADDKGKWQVKLAAVPAIAQPVEVTIVGKNTITLKNVLVGEVWVASGQSNMEWSVRNSENAEEEIKNAASPKIRLFTVQKKIAQEAQSDCVGSWSECSPATIPNFSAVAYFFGRDLHQKLNVPIGLINTSWGGTPAESWTTRETLVGSPDLKPIVERWDAAIAGFPKAKEAYEKAAAEHKIAADKAKADGKDAPKAPQAPQAPTSNSHLAASLYNGMIAPIVPFAIQGSIWYQGESNANRAYQYRKLLPAMITDWRKAWGQGDFPFLIVQLANFKATKPEPAESDWAELREAQTLTAATLAKTGQAVIIDIGDAADIHPKNKQDVGLRLALAGLHIAYGKELVYSGPTYEKMQVEASSVRLKFKHTGGGLVAKGGDALKGFAVAGDDHKFYWADARIDGDSVVVHCDQVAKPVAVRYAWADNPICNLFNKAGLPCCPFRTDDWEGITAKAR